MVSKFMFEFPLQVMKDTSFAKVRAMKRSTSGAILETRFFSQCSPTSHKIAALAWGTVILLTSRAIWPTISPCDPWCVCKSFLMTTTLSATTNSTKQNKIRISN